jgi:hypothetical protein
MNESDERSVPSNPMRNRLRRNDFDPETDELQHTLNISSRDAGGKRFSDPLSASAPDPGNPNRRRDSDRGRNDRWDDPRDNDSRFDDDAYDSHRYPDYDIPDGGIIPNIGKVMDESAGAEYDRDDDSLDRKPRYSARSDHHVASVEREPTRAQARLDLSDIIGLTTQDEEPVGSDSSTDRARTFQLANFSSWPVLLTAFALFMSLGFNLYLGWIAWDIHNRYRDVVEDLNEMESREADVDSRRGPTARSRDLDAERLATSS